MPEYLRRFNDLLLKLDPAETLAELQGLALRRALAMGYDRDAAAKFPPVVLCWESPSEFCHRQLVASWLGGRLGIDVPEVKAKGTQLELYVRRQAKKPGPVQQPGLW